jgi:hypothetical protein
VAHQLLDPRERHAGASAVHPEGVTQVVEAHRVQVSASTGGLEGTLYALVAVEWGGEDQVGGPAVDSEPVLGEELGQRIREVHRQCLEFWYDPPGCALTDEELELLRRIAAANAPVMFQAEGRTVPAHLAFDHRVDVLRDLRKAGWIVLEVWVAEPGNRGHARRRFSAAQAYCTESGREALELIGG